MLLSRNILHCQIEIHHICHALGRQFFRYTVPIIDNLYQLKGISLVGESLLYCLRQELSSYVVPELRYEGKYKLRLIIGTVHYIHCRNVQVTTFGHLGSIVSDT